MKISYLVHPKAQCKYDMKNEDWTMFYRLTTMDGLHFFVPVADFETSLTKQASGEEALDLD